MIKNCAFLLFYYIKLYTCSIKYQTYVKIVPDYILIMLTMIVIFWLNLTLLICAIA